MSSSTSRTNIAVSQAQQFIEKLYIIIKVTDENAKRDIKQLGFSDADDLKILEDEDVDKLANLTPTQKRKLKIIIKFVKITDSPDIVFNASFENIRKYVQANDRELQLHKINLPHYDGTYRGLNKWKNNVDCLFCQYEMSDLLDDKDFAKAQPKANKALYAMLYLAVYDTPAIDVIRHLPNRNGFQAWHALCTWDNDGDGKAQCEIREKESKGKSQNSTEIVNVHIDLPEYITNQLSEKVRTQISELDKEILMELKDNSKSSNGHDLNNEADSNIGNHKIPPPSANENTTHDTKRELPEHILYKRTKESAQEIERKGFDEIDEEDSNTEMNDTNYRDNHLVIQDDDGYPIDKVENEKRPFNDDTSARNIVTSHKRSSKRTRLSEEKQIRIMPSEGDHSASDRSVADEEEHDEYIDHIGPTHKINEKRNEDTDLEVTQTPYSKRDKPKGILLLERRPDSNILSPEPQMTREIEPKDNDVLFNPSHTSHYDKYQGNYRLKRLILDYPEDTAENVYFRFQVLYHSSRFLEKVIFGWEIMSKEKTLKIIFSRLKYGYREFELKSAPKQEVKIGNLPFDIAQDDIFIYRQPNNDYFVQCGFLYRNHINTYRKVSSQLVPSKIEVAANDIVHEVTSLDPPANFFIRDDKEDSTWKVMSTESSIEITSHFLYNGLTNDTDSMLIGESDDQSSKKCGVVLKVNDVVSHRYKPGHPGTVYYHELLNKYLDDTLTNTYAAIAETIFNHVKSTNPPGRFLKDIGKGEWEEQLTHAALKKIQFELSSKFKKRHRRKS